MHENGFWVFGYGSLIWNPGFDFVTRQRATLHGFHRSFCMTSVNYRGTEQDPGLVLALDALTGGSCTGVGFEVGPDRAAETYDYLTERELITAAYLETIQPITLVDGRQVDALTYVIDRDHVQYAKGLSLDQQADIIARAAGRSGPNRDYLANTLTALAEIGIADPEMEALQALVTAR
ncbi:MAG: gamma-glutamylcyclotransferase [Pseudomonadota bacterium]